MCDYKKFSECKVCGHQSVERLESYSHCLSCQNTQDHTNSSPVIPDWAQTEYRKISNYFDFQFARLNGGVTS